MSRALGEYARKRDFARTPEPSGARKKAARARATRRVFVVQEHHASHLHYDLRLELDGVLKSWAVPKGPSLDPGTKRLAVQVEDHPLEYGSFEGTIPEKQYGAGEVFLWDSGKWKPHGNPREGLRKGHLDFSLTGKRLHGEWVLVRLGGRSGKPNWLLMKRSDKFAKKKDKAVEIGKHRKAAPRVWTQSKTPLLEFVEPQLAQLVDAPPQGDQWIHETKFDGYRTQALVVPGRVSLISRGGHDWTEKYPGVEKDLARLKVKSAHLDGEIAWVDEQGRTDFQKLQSALKAGTTSQLIYFVFDLLALNGKDLRSLPLVKRKEELAKLLKPLRRSHIRLSEHLEGEGSDFLQVACAHQLEGIVSKQKDSPYLSGRSAQWVKAKCGQRQEFVIGGYTEAQGSRSHFGALLLGVYEGEKLRYVGKVGTGFNSHSLLSVFKRVSKLETKKSPFTLASPKERSIHWVKPKLVAEIAFANWTDDRHLRVPVFHGLREDKPPTQIHREKPVRAAGLEHAQINLTHPDKVLYAKEKLTKLDVAKYYLQVSRWLLPLMANRPLSLVRCPNGTSKTCFFQRHTPDAPSALIHKVPVKEKGVKKNYLAVDSIEGVEALVQMGAFELHAWNCHRDNTAFPDQFVMDLDPDPSVSWKTTVSAAFEVKELLDDLGLVSFVKVSGGKGVHLHVPIEPIYSWDDVKAFTQTIAGQLVNQSPGRYVAKASKAARRGKIFVDYLRNGFSATSVIPYSLRAKATSAVALPVTWAELKKLRSPDQFTLSKALAHLKKRRKDPWKEILETRQRIALLDRAPKSRSAAGKINA